jgi:hypothetical protein
MGAVGLRVRSGIERLCRIIRSLGVRAQRPCLSLAMRAGLSYVLRPIGSASTVPAHATSHVRAQRASGSGAVSRKSPIRARGSGWGKRRSRRNAKRCSVPHLGITMHGSGKTRRARYATTSISSSMDWRPNAATTNTTTRGRTTCSVTSKTAMTQVQLKTCCHGWPAMLGT